MSHISTLLISKSDKFNDIFHSKLIFTNLADEHVLRLIMLQKIKISRKLDDRIKIYLHNFELEDFELNDKLYKLLKYQSGVFNIDILNIENGYNKEEIIEYSNKISKK